MPDLMKYLSEETIAELRHQIADAGSNEVFFVGATDADKIVTSVQVYARGNEFQAPALLQVAKQGDVVLHNHPSGTLQPSSADSQVASILGNDGVGFYIINNPVTQIYAVIEPFKEKKIVPVKSGVLNELFAEKGSIAQTLENFEYRPQQMEMMAAVSAAINQDQIAVIEAGTGTGKTLSYLLPAINFALNNKERVVVSTNTINLQEQLVNKDLPFLQSVLQTKFNAVLVKGRTNYACKRKLAEADFDLDLFSENENVTELKAILDWAKTSKDGSKSDLSFIPKGDVWEKVQSESDTSLKIKCPFYNECFFYTARKKAAGADVLVANHHLLFSDLAIRTLMGASENAILPTYDRIIFDEAHNIEEVATNYFGVRVTSIGLQRIVNRLYQKKNDKEKGLLLYLSTKVLKLARALPHQDFLEIQSVLQKDGIAAVEKLNDTLAFTFDKLFSMVSSMSNEEPGFNEIKLRLTDKIVNKPEWQEQVVKFTEALVREIRRVTTMLNQFLGKLEAIQTRFGGQLLSLTVDLQAQLDRLDVVATNIVHVLIEHEETHVRWLEVKRGYNDVKIVRLQASPLNIAPILKQTVYEKFKNVVMTSATLTVAGHFEYLKKRLGLDHIEANRLIELQLGAPFDYEKQTLVAVPVDIPEPNQGGFAEGIGNIILESIRISRGRAFVLFTSYGLLNKIYFALKDRIEQLGINVYKQGNENRHRLLERFKEDISSVLFATDSFWEGVDVHGEALESVIITKLPFKVPSEPIIEARVEAIEKNGGNAFLEYTVPQAAIKFKQGFGRLIRRKTDRGTVLILDKRVVQKNYGRTFLNSLPKTRFAVGCTKQVLAELGEFYASVNNDF